MYLLRRYNTYNKTLIFLTNDEYSTRLIYINTLKIKNKMKTNLIHTNSNCPQATYRLSIVDSGKWGFDMLKDSEHDV